MPDDLHIHLGEPTTRAPAEAKRPCEPAFAIDRVGGGEPEEPEVYLHVSAVEQVMRHMREDQDHELGGLLCGQAAEDGGGRFLTMTGAVAATLAHGERLCLTFTHEAWAAMLAEKERLYPGEAIVGWYHTHPGLGVFLSAPDQFIHSSFFAAPTQVALVIDPRTFVWGLFHWHGDELRAMRRYFLYGPADANMPELARLLRECARR
jgi:proteasome lid subunit RPN8/RPN11